MAPWSESSSGSSASMRSRTAFGTRSVSTIWRPWASQNVVARLSAAALVPGGGFKDLFDNAQRHRVYASVLANVTSNAIAAAAANPGLELIVFPEFALNGNESTSGYCATNGHDAFAINFCEPLPSPVAIAGGRRSGLSSGRLPTSR